MDERIKLKKYLILAFGFAWAFWWIDVALTQLGGMKESEILPKVLFIVGGFGPFVAALSCLDGGFSLRHLKEFLLAHKPGRWWYLILFAALEIGVFALSSKGLAPGIPKSPVILPVFLGILLLMTLVFGGSEELGWRGTMGPILNHTMPRVLAPLVIGMIWSFWHIPLWFIAGDSHQSLSFFAFLVLGIALSYWLASLYDMTGSVPACMLIHGLTNTIMGFFVMGTNPWFIVGILFLTTVAVVASYRTRSEGRAGTDRGKTL